MNRQYLGDYGDVDYTDDWMDPKPTEPWTYKEENKVKYLIERASKRICFGNPGYVIHWSYWASFDTAKERDKEIAKLRKEHPIWRLRARTDDPFHKNIHYCRG